MGVGRRKGQGGTGDREGRDTGEGGIEGDREGEWWDTVRGRGGKYVEQYRKEDPQPSAVAMTTATLYTCTLQCTMYICTHMYVSTFSVLSPFLFSYMFLLSIS